MLLSFVQAVVACSVTGPRVCTLVQAKIRQDTRLWHYSGLKPTIFASSVQAAVASNVTAPRVCTLVLFIIHIYVIRRCHLLVPVGPRATGKRKAGSITSGTWGKTE